MTVLTESTASTVSKRFPALPNGLWTPLLFLLLAGMLWLPTGLNGGSVGDSWPLYYYIDKYGFHVPDVSRPLVYLPSFIAYTVTPGHFTGFNLIILLLIAAKGWLIYAIMRQFKFALSLAVAVGVLAMLLPADDGLYYLGAIAVYFANVFALLAVYLMLVYWQRPRLSTEFVLWISQLISLLTYEAAYPLFIVAPLAIYLQYRQFNARFKRLLFAWYVFPTLLIVFFPLILLLSGQAGYQRSIFQLPSLVGLMNSVANVYLRHFVTSWFARDFPYQTSLLIYALGSGLIAGLVCWRVYVRDTETPTGRYWTAIGAGFLVIFLSVAPYMVTTQRNDLIRLFFVSTAGAAAVIVCGLWLIVRSRLGFSLVIALLVTIGALRLLEQHVAWKDRADQEVAFLAKLAYAVHDVTPQTGVVIMDQTGTLITMFGGGWYLEQAGMILYDRADAAFAICTSADLGHDCNFTPMGLIVNFDQPGPFWSASYDRLIVLTYDGQLSIASSLAAYTNVSSAADYQPAARVLSDSPLPERLSSMFGVAVN